MSTWLPLESNPDVLTRYIHKLGVGKNYILTDVLGLEPEMLEWIPKPVKAIILLFPMSEEYERHRREEQERLAAEKPKYPDDLFYMRQFTSNACGTVALIHSVANNKDIPLEAGILKNFLENTKDMNPEGRGKALEEDKTFTQGHQELAQEGQTTADANEKVNHHFITFVNSNGTLYELDGRKSCPVSHGSSSEETFVKDAANVCQQFMERDPLEVRFTIMALTAADD